MSERTHTKLREAKFFFKKLVRESEKVSLSEPEAFIFYLNAFVTAGESVRCFLEKDYGYERRRAVGVFKFMNEQRRIVVHREGSPDVELVWVHVPMSELRSRSDHPAYRSHFFAPPGTPLPTIGKRSYSFRVDDKEVSVIQFCREYLDALEKTTQGFTRSPV
jgi:hypothetical protein